MENLCAQILGLLKIILHLEKKMESLLLSGVPILEHITAIFNIGSRINLSTSKDSG